MKVDFEKGGGLVPAIIQDAWLYERGISRKDPRDKEGDILESWSQVSLDKR